jgi:uncharacterized protein (DUF433 family)
MDLVTTPQIRIDDRGVAWIDGTTTKVTEVVMIQLANGLSPEEIQAGLPHLSLEQVAAALAYFHTHRKQLEEQIAELDRWAEEMRSQEQNPITRAELQARLQRKG